MPRMRIFSTLLFLAVLCFAPRAFADLIGCGPSDERFVMSVPADMATPADLRERGARLEQRRRNGRGLVVLSGTSVLGMLILRRRRETR